jgi:hypothetical protein
MGAKPMKTMERRLKALEQARGGESDPPILNLTLKVNGDDEPGVTYVLLPGTTTGTET